MSERNSVPRPAQVPFSVDKPVVSPDEKATKSSKKANIQRWWTIKGAEHSIVGKKSPKDPEPTKITMHNFIYDCDMDTDEGRQVSREFKNSGFAQANLFIIVDKDESTKEGKIAAKNFRDTIEYVLAEEGRSRRGLRHVIAILTKEELKKHGLDFSNVNVAEVVNALYETKSFAVPSEYE